MSNIIEVVGSTPKFSWQKDHISELPDEVLLVILSRLTIKEAARTSVLSHRWETLWTFISSLNFDASETLDYLQKRLRCLHYERVQYPRWVNQALNSHKAPTIEEFRICFYLTNNSADDINRWISFAIKKGVQKLEVNLSSLYLTDWYKMPWQPFGIASFNSLRALHLNNVDFDDEVLEHLICSSPFLEHLCIEDSFSLKNFKIGPSIHLKYVEIFCCENLINIEISAIYLVSFKYNGRGKIRLHFENVPRLVEVSFAGMFHSVVDISRQLSSHLWQLQKLVLDMTTECSNSSWSYLTEFPKWRTLSNLRHLELKASVGGGMIIYPILFLLEASPFIHTFKLQLNWRYYSPILVPERKARKVVMKKHRPHQFLEVVELLGFVGDTGDTEIALYLLEETVSLKRLIVSPYDLELSCIPSEFVDREKLLTRECAIQLGTKLPPGAKFHLLEN